MTDPLNLVGQNFGEYHVHGFRGRGGFAYVYAAEHRSSNALVALKILRPNAGWPQHREFDNEGSLLLRLNKSSSVVDIFDSGDETTTATLAGGVQIPLTLRYHVLELADSSLDTILPSLASLDWPSRLSFLRDITLGVHQMHGKGLVHRDLKSANCLLFPQGQGTVRVKLNDLGRSRDLSQPAGALPLEYAYGRGDPDFSPPELLCGIGEDIPRVHRCADLYGIGSVMFELALGQGISGVALFPNAARILAVRSLRPDERRNAYQAGVPEFRSWYEPAFQVFELAVPKAIRGHAGRLIRQLCDPDPQMRLPQVAPGRRAPRPDELRWLLDRIDVLRLTLQNDMRQTERLRSRKGV